MACIYRGALIALDGVTPVISKDGHWMTGPYDTGVDARGLDGNPIGSIALMLGHEPPTGYLVCDGSVLAIADYVALSTYIATHLGAVNHYGGDGVTTFAIPDFRNLFLRGYHGDAAEQLSGEIGRRQEGSKIPNLNFDHDDGLWIAVNNSSNIMSESSDFADGAAIRGNKIHTDGSTQKGVGKTEYFYPRPVNTAVLLCVKYI